MIFLAVHSIPRSNLQMSLSINKLPNTFLFLHKNPPAHIHFVLRMSVIQVRVPNLDCKGCATKIRKALFKLDGVDEIDIEMETQKITIRGHAVEEKKVIKTVRRAGKAAEPWPFPAYSHYS